MNTMEGMIDDIVRDTQLTGKISGVNKISERVIQAMRAVPRDQFLQQHHADLAFHNGPLPIGYGQTISQPFIVALMTELLATTDQHKVLEVGTGCGYQTCILAKLVAQVYTVEIISELSMQAQERFELFQIENIHSKVGDGYYGWAEFAPYDRIMVTAAAPTVPPPLIEQLKPGGKMVIPVGYSGWGQELTIVEKNEAGAINLRQVLSVSFVPLTGDLGGDTH